MKKCNRCQELKELTEFYKSKNNKGGLSTYCKRCKYLVLTDRKKDSEYLKKFKAVKKRYVINNKEKHYSKVKEHKIKTNYDKIYYQKNKEILLEKSSKNYHNNQEYFNNINKEYYYDHKDHLLKLIKERAIERKNNPILHKKDQIRSKNYQKEYLKKNPHIKILRGQIQNIKLKLGTKKEKSAIKELGYTPLEFKKCMENFFIEKMDWDNLGNGENKWNIDHKIPVTWFKKETPFYVVNHLENLQPMWGDENRSKGNYYHTNISQNYFNICKQYILENKLSVIEKQLLG